VSTDRTASRSDWIGWVWSPAGGWKRVCSAPTQGACHLEQLRLARLAKPVPNTYRAMTRGGKPSWTPEGGAK
jgi:hypothetical protein